MPAERRRVAFRCDASAQIGGGHVMRCLTLANALSQAGAQVMFVAAAMPDALAERIARGGHRLEIIPASPELQRDGPEWEEPALSEKAQLADAKATGAAIGRSDRIVVDHYLLDAHWHSAARALADHLLVIDDLANRTYDCDILLDQNLGRSVDDYRTLVPDGAKILAGATYALLRPEFAHERPAALERRKNGGSVRRILVSMGTADPGGITAHVAEQLLAAAPGCAIDVVVGPQAASLEQLRDLAARHSPVSVYVDSERMAELMRDADIAVGAAGATSWERCCLGLPSILLVLAENQRAGAQALAASGASLVADHVGEIGTKLRSLIDSGEAVARLSAAAFAVTDGRGTGRVLDAMHGEESRGEVLLRPATFADSEMLWLWRNDPLMRSMAKTTDPIAWADHERWFERVLGSSDTELYIAERSGEPAAMVRFDRYNERAIVSINVAPQLRGRGIGTEALASACDAYGAVHPEAFLWAEVRHTNIASKATFRAAGFKEVKTDSPELAGFVRSHGANEDAAR